MTFILVTLGNAPQGWDELVVEADRCATEIDAAGLIQFGGSRVRPRRLEGLAFVPQERLVALMRIADIVVSHGGMGSIGDCLRNARRFIVVPRAADPRAAVGNQVPVATRLGQLFAFPVVSLGELTRRVAEALAAEPRQPITPRSDVPTLIEEFVARFDA